MIALGARTAALLVVGGLLVQLGSVLDGCDGEVARATLRSSRFGELLDTILDRLADLALLIALAAAAGFDSTTWAALATAIATALYVPYVKAAYKATAHAPLPYRRASFGRDARLLTIAVCALALQPQWALVAVALLSAAEGVARSAHALRAAHGT